LADIASHNTSDSTTGSAAQSLSDAHKATETSAEQWSDSTKKVDQLQKAEQYTRSEDFKSDANLNKYLEDYISHAKPDIAKDDIGARQEIANSDEFAEYVLHNAHIDVDLNGDGKTEGWDQDMDDKEKHTGEHIPTASDTAPTTANHAAAQHGLVAGQMPVTPTSQQVDKKLAAGEKQAEADNTTLHTGENSVQHQSDTLQGDIGGQSTFAAGRVAGAAIDKPIGFLKETATAALEGHNLNIIGKEDKTAVNSSTKTEPLETVSFEGPKFDGRSGKYGDAEVHPVKPDEGNNAQPKHD